MKVYVPVNKAVQNGRLTVNLPGALLFLIFLIGVPSLLIQYTEENWIIITGIVVGFVLGFCLGWIYSGFAVVRWKIWAYENVKNINELKEKAILEKVIYADGHWSDKWKFATYEQRQKLKQLERRFSEKDEYHDDLNVSKETAIHVSKQTIYFFTALGLVIIGVAIYRYSIHQNSNAITLALLSLIFFGIAYNDYRKKEPQILISNTGIKLYKKEVMLWEFIMYECVQTVRYHNKHNKYLCFDYNGEEQKVLINNLGTNVDELEHILQVYRLRYEKNNPGK